MSRIDHYETARRLAQTADGVLPGETWEAADERRRSDLARAQVHATLAVADALRSYIPTQPSPMSL